MVERLPAPKFLKDIRLWIAFFFLLRMYGITLPPLEVVHNIRQTDGLMIARNFYEQDANIFFPTIDVAGEKSGIVGCEFPLLNYLICLISRIFGFEDWYGRVINLTVSSLGVYCLFRLIKNYFGEDGAFNTAMLLLVSLWFSYSRKTIPDTFAGSLCLIGLYFAFQYLEKDRIAMLMVYFVFALAGSLSKISATVLLSVLAIPFFFGSYAIRKKAAIAFVSTVILALVYWWYFVWVPYLNDKYEFPMFFMGWSLHEGVDQLVQHWPGVLKQFYDKPLKYTGFLAFALGMFLLIRHKQRTALAVFFLPFILFGFVIIKSGSYFVTNEYYILIIIPAMAFVAGVGLSLLENRRLVALALFVIAVEGVTNQAHDFRIRSPYAEMEGLEAVMDRVSGRSDLIAINGEGSGTPMFFAHRRGWVSTNDMLSSAAYMDDLTSKGCKYVLILKKSPWRNIHLPFKAVYDSDFFKVYKIQ